jgi:RNA polymerase sigma factor (TIGR02999 family)
MAHRRKIADALPFHPTPDEDNITTVLRAIDGGDFRAGDSLLPLVYDDLRKAAAAQLARERPGHTLDSAALVHEAWLRLAGITGFAGKSHFFRSAAEAMRRILIDHARSKRAMKRGGERVQFRLNERDALELPDSDTLLAIDEALAQLANDDPGAAEIARLRLFAGLSVEEAGEMLGVSRATAFRDWNFARAVLTAALRPSS